VITAVLSPCVPPADKHVLMADPHIHPPLNQPEYVGETGPTSNLVSGSFALSLLSYLMCCFGPALAIPSLIMGILGVRKIQRSQGREGGKSLAIISIALSGFNLLLWPAAAVAIFANINNKSSTRVATPAIYPPPTSTSYSPSKPSPVAIGGEMTRSKGVLEVKVGDVTLVDLVPTTRSLVTELNSQRKAATQAHQGFVLFVSEQGCRPCMSVTAVLPDPLMQAALKNVRIVRVNSSQFTNELNDLGIPTRLIPGFFLFDAQMNVRDGVNGGEWDDDIAANISPVLGPFVRGTYTKRRERFRPVPPSTNHPPTRTPRPKGTVL
jgi:hypothetical protein